jgi:hypothetical protein
MTMSAKLFEGVPPATGLLDLLRWLRGRRFLAALPPRCPDDLLVALVADARNTELQLLGGSPKQRTSPFTVLAARLAEKRLAELPGDRLTRVTDDQLRQVMRLVREWMESEWVGRKSRGT